MMRCTFVTFVLTVNIGCLTVLLADYMSDDTALKEGCGQGLIEGMLYSLH